MRQWNRAGYFAAVRTTASAQQFSGAILQNLSLARPPAD